MIEVAYGRLKNITEQCTVQILSMGITGGSGFFVAPGVVASCAHVVYQEGTESPAETATVLWDGVTYTGSVRAAGGPAQWHYPDLCVIELTNPPRDHPWVILGNVDEVSAIEYYQTGYNTIYVKDTPGFFSTRARLDGKQELPDGMAWKIDDREVPAGASGGPVLELPSGVVCGIVKMQRKPGSPMGGLMIPATRIRNEFPDVWQLNQVEQYEPWHDLRRTIHATIDPFDGKLLDAERERLIARVGQLQLTTEDFNRLYYAIADEWAPVPARRLDTIIDLASELAELPDHPLSPFAQLFALLANWAQQGDGGLRADAEAIARVHRQHAAFRQYHARDLSDWSAAPLPIVVIRLTSDGNAPQEVLLTMWYYKSPEAAPLRFECAPGPYPLPAIEQTITRILATQAPGLDGGRKPLIEFALPDHLLDHPVERWEMRTEEPLGIDHPVVIRFSARDSAAEDSWHEKQDEFRRGQFPSRDSSAWDELWIDCLDSRGPKAVEDMLKNSGRLPVLAMTAWHAGEPVPPGVSAARQAGAPVIVWQHEPCGDHPRRADDAMTTRCRGGMFKDMVAEHLSAVDLQQLPERVRRARERALRGNGYATVHDIAILWDDPSRVPWQDLPRMRVPG